MTTEATSPSTPPTNVDAPSILDRIDVIALGLGVVLAVICYVTVNAAAAASALAGCALGILNFAAIRFLISRMMDRMNSDGSGGGSLGVLFFMKFFALAGTIFVLTKLADTLDGVAFSVGFLTILVAATAAALLWKLGMLDDDTHDAQR